MIEIISRVSQNHLRVVTTETYDTRPRKKFRSDA